jgi:predicted transcriptional regulator
MKSKVVLTEENGTWLAHDPTVPGHYGLGPTRVAALADLAEAKATLDEYVVGQEAAEDAADVRAADASMAEVLAGGRVFTHEEVLARFGLGQKKRTRPRRRRR